MYDKFQNIKPFQCFYNTSGIIVNYGVIVGSNQDIAQEYLDDSTTSGLFENFGALVPKINNTEIVKFTQSGFSQTNFLPFISSSIVVTLKLKLENIENLVESKYQEWRGIVVTGDATHFQNVYNRDFSAQLQRRYFNLETGQSVSDIDFESNNMLDYARNCEFNPFVNWSPKIEEVTIEQIPYTGSHSLLSEDSTFYTIQRSGDDYYKYVPISIVDDFNVTQLLSKDYVFSFPFFWLDSLKEEFKYVPAETSNN